MYLVRVGFNARQALPVSPGDRNRDVEHHPHTQQAETALVVNVLAEFGKPVAGDIQDLLAGDPDHIDVRVGIRVVMDRVIPRLSDHVDRAQIRPEC